MPAAPSITSLQSVIAGLATGSSKSHEIGTRHSGPTGIESIIEYRSEYPIYLNVVDWIDTFLVITINGLDSADLRASAQPNPGEHGETPNDPLWGGRTIILAGKQYAHTIWKLRDMQQGLRASFLDIQNEYPLIFHAADPVDDLMIMCKLADKINLPDQQTTRNEYVRDFQIALRASNPRFLSVVRERQTVQAIKMADSFDANVPPPVLEDFSLAGGLSAGYVETGKGYSPGSGFLLPKAIKRNWIANPRGYGGVSPPPGVFVDPACTASLYVAGGYSISQAYGGNANSYRLVASTADAAGTPQRVIFTSYGKPSVGSPTSGPPFVTGGERLRFAGWWFHDGIGGAPAGVYAQAGLQVVNAVGVVQQTITLAPKLFINGDSTYPAGPTGQWHRFDFKYTNLAGVTGWVQPYIELISPSAQWPSAGTEPQREIYVTDLMLGLDDDSVAYEFVARMMAGTMQEGAAELSPSRRIYPIANYVKNPSGKLTNPTQFWFPNSASQSVVTGAAQPPLYGTSWFRATADNTASGQGKMGIATTNILMNFGNPLVFSFYARKATAGTPARVVRIRLDWVDAATNSITSNTSQDFAADTDVFTRYVLPVTPPPNTIKVYCNIYFVGAIPQNEAHEIAWVMLHEGNVAQPFAMINGVQDNDPTYISASPNQTSEPGETVGPIAQRNYAIDPDFDMSGMNYVSSVGGTALYHSSGGALDNGPCIECVRGASSLSYYGAGWGLGDAELADVTSDDTWAGSIMARVPSGVRTGTFVFNWFNAPNSAAFATSTVDDIFTITDTWQTFSFSRVKPPPGTISGFVDFRVTNPQAGDSFFLDKKIAVKAGEPTYFDGDSEFAEWGPTNSHIATRYVFERYQTPRTFTEGQQTVKFHTSPNSGPAALWNALHLGLAYIDEDNQIFVGCGRDGVPGIWVRKLGVQNRVAGGGAALAVNTADTDYWMRGRLHDGVAFLEVYNSDPYAGTVAAGVIQPIRNYQYTLTADDTALFQSLSYMTLGIQETGARWKIDEWRYGDMIEPQNWLMRQGAGTVTISNNKIIPLDMSMKMLTPANQVKIGDGSFYVKVRYETLPPQGINAPSGLKAQMANGVAFKVIDNNNFLVAFAYGNATANANNITCEVGKYDNGVYTMLGRVAAKGYVAPATDAWVQGSMAGNSLGVQVWDTDPALGGSPDINKSASAALAGADIAKFGTGVTGGVGLFMKDPVAPLNATMDDFWVKTTSFDNVAVVAYNKGNYDAQTVIELTGPMTNPRVTNETNGTSFLINGTIPTGETWVLENNGPRKRFYRKSDGANRFTYLDSTSMWVVLEPNMVANNIRLTASALDTGWDMAIYYRHTYM